MNKLAPIGWLYGLVTQVRNGMYDLRILKIHDLGAKTISVGNITAGGTGKTPLVKLIAEILSENGEKVCILTRGYGRKNENERVVVCSRDTVVADPAIAGDEPVELARHLLGRAIIIADADRVEAAKWAMENFAITAFVLDDAFQHRRVKRDLDVVCVDAADPFGNGRLLPAGRLRETTAGLGRADAIVITRSDQSANLEQLKNRLRKTNNKASIFTASVSISVIVKLEEFHARTQGTQRELPSDAFAFAGLANNKNFFEGLKSSGIKTKGQRGFRDHHIYKQRDLDEIQAQAEASGARSLVTTAKDAVKLEGIKCPMQCYVVEVETVINDLDRFRDFVLSV